MRIFTGAFAIVLMIFLAGSSRAADVDAKKLIGKWVAKDDQKGITRTVEFKKDGKLSVNVEVGDKSSKFEGTYKVAGDKITLTATFNGKEITQSVMVHKQTDNEIEATSEESKETRTYKRVKEKK